MSRVVVVVEAVVVKKVVVVVGAVVVVVFGAVVVVVFGAVVVVEVVEFVKIVGNCWSCGRYVGCNVNFDCVVEASPVTATSKAISRPSTMAAELIKLRK